MSEYPHKDGDFTVIGPECFASPDGKVISWRGENYVRQAAFGMQVRGALAVVREWWNRTPGGSSSR